MKERIDVADEASGPEPEAQAAGSDTFVVSADLFKYWVIDRDAGTVQIVGQDDGGHEKLPGDGHETARWRT